MDPSNHARRTQPVAGRARWVVLDIEHARQGDAVIGPAAAVGQEEIRLSCSRTGVRMSKVVTATNETSVGCADVVA